MEGELMTEGELMMEGNMSMGPCDSMGGMNMSMSGGGGMAMYFTFSGHQCSFLFPNLNLDTPAAMFGAIVLVIIVAILYEGLKSLREFLASLENPSNKKTKTTSPSSQSRQDGSVSKDGSVSLSNGVQSPSHIVSPERTPLIQTKPRQPSVLKLAVDSWLSPLHLLQSVLHVVQVGVAYLLVLVAMTYNGWLFLSVCVGAGLGYFIFARCTRSINAIRSNSDHCHN